MCGLIGFISPSKSGFVYSDATVFKQLLYIDTLRGEDSTGVAAFYNTGQMEIIKEASPAYEFLETKEFARVSTRLISQGVAVLGHNRKRTSGNSDSTTAHPFVINGLDGNPRYAFIHNGTLNNHTHLEKQLSENLKSIDCKQFTIPSSGVDSEILGTMLCHSNGDANKIEQMLAHVNGAYACMWIDQEKEMLYMLRNKERPLTIGYSKVGTFLASEGSMIHLAAQRNNILIDKYVVVDEDTLYSLNLNTGEVTFKEEKLTIKKSFPIVHTQNYGHMVWAGKGKKTTTAVNDWEEPASKNSMKRFRKQFVGESISFWMDDYIQTTFPETPSFVVFGVSLMMDKTKHLIRGMIKGKTRPEVDDMVGRLISGTISAVDWEADKSEYLIHVKDLKVNEYIYQTCH